MRTHLRLLSVISCSVLASAGLIGAPAAADPPGKTPFAGFDEPEFYFAGVFPRALALADFNGDGFIDIAVTDLTGDSVWILWNNGAGEFARNTHIPDIEGPTAAVTLDLEGDGDIDLVVVQAIDPSQANALVFENDGRGVLTLIDTIPVEVNPLDVRAADLDNDGDDDVVVVSLLQNGVAILRNDRGTLTHSGFFVAGPWPGQGVVADFDGDGDIDIALALALSDNVALLLNRGDATFAEPMLIPSGNTAPARLTAGDFDNDGDVDFIVGGGGDIYHIYRNVGPGPAFTRFSIVVWGQDPGAGDAADVDGDGNLDFINNRQGLDSIVVMFGVPDGMLSNFLDVNGSMTSEGVVDALDILSVVNDWGSALITGAPGLPANGGADLTGDGRVNGLDLALILSNWGPIDAPDDILLPVNSGFISHFDVDNDGDIDIVCTAPLTPAIAIVKNRLR